jgi:hypothetical protein
MWMAAPTAAIAAVIFPCGDGDAWVNGLRRRYYCVAEPLDWAGGVPGGEPGDGGAAACAC